MLIVKKTLIRAHKISKMKEQFFSRHIQGSVTWRQILHKKSKVHAAELDKDLCDSQQFGACGWTEEDLHGCGMWLKMGFSLVEEG